MWSAANFRRGVEFRFAGLLRNQDVFIDGVNMPVVERFFASVDLLCRGR